MNTEQGVLAALAVASLLLVTLFGRMDRPRESLFLFVMAQAITWPLTILTVYLGRMESPVRLFAKATDSNFIMSFVFFPAIIVAYYWHYPRTRSRICQIAYTLAVAGGTSLIHIAVEHHTALLRYITFSGYHLWLMGAITNYLIRIYADWYFYRLAQERAGHRRWTPK